VDALNREVELTEIKLARAEKLVNLLKSEGETWESRKELLTSQIELIAGNILLSAAQVSYFGSFVGYMRIELLNKWMKRMREKGIRMMEDYSLEKSVGDAIKIRDWNI
jgi:dynein heavy chain, axonemal